MLVRSVHHLYDLRDEKLSSQIQFFAIIPDRINRNQWTIFRQPFHWSVIWTIIGTYLHLIEGCYGLFCMRIIIIKVTSWVEDTRPSATMLESKKGPFFLFKWCTDFLKEMGGYFFHLTKLWSKFWNSEKSVQNWPLLKMCNKKTQGRSAFLLRQHNFTSKTVSVSQM